jgi:hypothetical protein
MKDYFGREINRGDRVVYPGRRSSSLWMNDGTVIACDPKLVVEKVLRNWRGEEVGRNQVTLWGSSRVVIVAFDGEPL